MIPRVDVPTRSKILPCLIKIKKKRIEDGSIDNWKARMCNRGHKKKYGVDYDETFAAVIDFQTVRLMLSIAVKENMFVDHVEVIGAFLLSDINIAVFMEHPRGVVALKMIRKKTNCANYLRVFMV